MDYTVTLTFTQPILGTTPLNKELYADYIATKSPNGDAGLDELDTIEELTEKGTTGFHRSDSGPIIYDYVIKGFFKDAAGMLRRVPGSASSKVTAYRKVVDGLIFVSPRLIPLASDQPVAILERPLRAQTAQGERVALSRSEMLAAGATLTFTVSLLDARLEPLLREWLDYGKLRGLGQWRNGGYGTFTYEIAPVA